MLKLQSKRLLNAQSETMGSWDNYVRIAEVIDRLALQAQVLAWVNNTDAMVGEQKRN